MSNVNIEIRTFLNESINMKAQLKECFSDEKRFITFRAKTAAFNLKNLKQVRAARTGYLSL